MVPRFRVGIISPVPWFHGFMCGILSQTVVSRLQVGIIFLEPWCHGSMRGIFPSTRGSTVSCGDYLSQTVDSRFHLGIIFLETVLSMFSIGILSEPWFHCFLWDFPPVVSRFHAEFISPNRVPTLSCGNGFPQTMI